MNHDIIHIAIENLRHTAGVEACWQDGGPLDGMLDIAAGDMNFRFAVLVRRELRIHQVPQIVDFTKHDEHVILIAKRLFPKIKEALRQKGLPYLEANGNVYLKKQGLYLLIDTQKPLEIKKHQGNRAFTKTGLKVLFHLLQHKEDINLTQRELADRVGVGLGNIPMVIEGLMETGYIIPLNKKEYVWDKTEALIERWIDGYATQLRPKLIRERCTLKGNWQNAQFDDTTTVWGGEPAADILTNHLRPEIFKVYTNESRIDLIRKYQLIPDIDGEIEVLEMFWKPTEGRTAPPLLVYADLILEGSKRNTETAVKIFDEYIRPNL